ncbi:hypothetical protein HJC23_008855 [Cyclotella cryptica]|uniref:Uncharacterized protein n=1 Tax=Cyclotella cryptica TaxID=29204 RepID=A0ABD3NNM1_9STRA
MCHEHQISVRYHQKRTAKVNVIVKGGYEKDYKTRRDVSAAHYLDAHSEAEHFRDMTSQNDEAIGPLQSEMRRSLASDFLDDQKIHVVKRESRQGRLRLSFISDISYASGFSCVQNDETDSEEDTYDHSRRGDYHSACHLETSTISTLCHESLLDYHKSDEQADSPRGPKQQQASLSFLPIELTTVQNDPDIYHWRNAVSKSSLRLTDSSEGSVFSDDFTLTGLFLDDASDDPHSANMDNPVECKCEIGPRKCRIRRDRASNNLFLSSNYALPVSVSLKGPEDDSIASVCGSPASSVFATSYQIRTKGSSGELRKQQPRRSPSNALLKLAAAMFKKTKLTHRSDCDLIVGFTDRHSKSEYDCAAKVGIPKVLRVIFRRGKEDIDHKDLNTRYKSQWNNFFLHCIAVSSKIVILIC